MNEKRCIAIIAKSLDLIKSSGVVLVLSYEPHLLIKYHNVHALK